MKKTEHFWVRGIFKEENSEGDFHNLEKELRLTDREFYFSVVTAISVNFLSKFILFSGKI